MRLIYSILALLMFSACSQKGIDGLMDREMTEIAANSEMMKKDILVLADDKMEGRETGTAGEKMAADYIKTRMMSIGLKPGINNSFFQDFDRRIRANPHATEDSSEDEIVSVRNVVGMVDNGQTGTIVIGAHYDHLGYGGEGSLHSGDKAIHNGADDNASGVSIMLDLAHRLQSNGYGEKHNIVFIGFSGEEKGLWGSNYYVKNTDLDLEDMSFMINMDMVGRLNAERKLAINGVGTSPKFDKVLDTYNKYNFGLVKKESGVGPSDHTSFYLENVPVLHLFTGQHSDYHKPSDDTERINYNGMADISDYLYNLILDLDNEKDLEFVKTKDESTETPRFKVTLGVIPDYLYDGKGMRIDGVKEDRPAHGADIRKGDIVIKMGDLDISDMMGYMKALSEHKVGDEVTVIILRDGKEMKKTVKF